MPELHLRPSRFLRRVPHWAWPTSTLLFAVAALVGLWRTSSWVWGALLLAAAAATGGLGAWHDTRPTRRRTMTTPEKGSPDD